ncbi:hypothetical protein RRG08_001446 [Elysia crispata]|uniref:Reverse transcriptase domain-containing protein n=1 Tax=Elysia crispata TaxID=231223 RepID=A0AAE1DKE8_9GAST|nr:hypothetical protein RRG08_001446 [Elysia crispata]
MNAKELYEQFTSKVQTVDKIESRGPPKMKLKAVPKQSQGKTPSRPTATPTANKKQCYRCGYTNHPADYTCNDCHKKGHLAKVCRSRGRQHQTTKQIVDEQEDYISHNSSRDGRKAFYIMMNMNGKDVKTEIDTGSGVTTVPDSVVQETFKNEVELQTSTQILKTYNGSNIPLKGTKARIHLKEDAQPRFFKPRPVPYAVKAKVEEELRKLEKDNIITKVTHSEWAAPLVVVPKENGIVRLCGDFKVTINGEMRVDQYTLPTVQDLFATLSNGKKLTKLDLTQAYHQLEEDSKPYVTISTHIGLFRYNRMPYGIASGPAIFQEILSDIEGVQVFIDDIRLTGTMMNSTWKGLTKCWRLWKIMV